MKKSLVLIGSILLAANLFAHDHFLYTSNLDASNQKEVKMKAILAHPAEGPEVEPVSIATVDGKTSLPKAFFVVHDGVKTDLLSKVKVGTIKTAKGQYVALDAVYTAEDGLKGGGSWVFVMDSGNTKDSGYMFNPVEKLIITKDSAGSDYNQRVAPGYNEIVPLVNPVNAWKENVFRAKFVDKDGNPIKNARIDVDFINGKLDMTNNTWTANKEAPKTSLRVFTDDNGVFAFVPSRSGQWVIRAVASMDKQNKVVHDASLVVQFE